MQEKTGLRDRVVGITNADARSNGSGPRPSAAASIAEFGLDNPIITGAPIAVYAVDLEGRVVAWNRRCEQLFGWTADEVLGELIPIVPHDGVESALDGLTRLMDGEVLDSLEATLQRRDGELVNIVVSSTLLRDGGEPAAIISFAVDLTAERRAHERLASTEAKWRMLFENISDTVTVTDSQGYVRHSTGEFTDVLGLPTDEWSDLSVFDLLEPGEVDAARAAFAELLANPEQQMSREFRMLDHNSGTIETIEITGINALADPEVQGIVFTTRNVTARRAAQDLLADEAAVLELIARDAPLCGTLRAVADMLNRHTDGLVVIGPYVPWHSGDDTMEVVASPADAVPVGYLDALSDPDHVRLFGSESTVEAKPLYFDDLELAADLEGIRTLVDAGFRSAVVAPIVEAGEDEVLGSISIILEGQREPADHVMDVLAVAVQLSAIAVERYRALGDLTHQALHDQLTGLPNRHLVMQRLGDAIDDPERQGRVGVMLLDLDRFKVVNDSVGHGVGDRLLLAFSERLRAIVRPGDSVGRFEGDEFVIVLPDIDDVNDVRSIANRLDLTLSEPFETEHGDLVLSASIGTAISRDGDSAADLIKHADTACSRAKDLGGDRLEVFDDELRRRAEERLHLERDLRAAIERSDLVLHYQPEIDLRSGRIIGVEALLRWNHPERGLVYPSDFIGLSEETGLITRIGRWVLAEAVHQAATLADRLEGADPLMVSVNLSARQLSTPNFTQSVASVLNSYDWPPHQLVFEVTENILVDDTDARLEILQDLHDVGIKVAIDDFGTGFSSLSYLHRFPVDVIKLDRTFVEPLAADGSGSMVAKAVTHLAHDLGLTVVAEGVETAEQLAGLRALGCDWAQGFHFAKALPSEELGRMLARDPLW